MEKKKKKYKKPEIIKIPVDFKELVRNITGGCPFVFVWDGREYVKENSILPDSEDFLRKEKILIDYYVLQNEPAVKNGKLSFKIKELANDISWFDSFSLLTVEHQANYKIGFSPQGEMLGYKKPRLPLHCQGKDYGDYLSYVTNRDWQNPTKFYEGKEGDNLELDFGKIAGKSVKLIIVDPRNSYAAMCPAVSGKSSIHFYILINYEWQYINTLQTRAEFYPDIVDLTPHLPQIKGNLRIKLEFTARHKVAFVGIDTTPPIPMEKRVYPLVQAIHTEFGDVTDILKENNDKFIRLYPGEEIELRFPVPKPAKPGNKLSYVLVSKGYYIPTAKIVSLAKSGEIIVEQAV